MAYTVPAGDTFAGFVVQSTKGQGNAKAPIQFKDHAVAELSTTPTSVYDPSYGKWYPSEQAWRDASEEQFYSTFAGTNMIDPDSSEPHTSGKNDSTFRVQGI
jgi:hypothetical protein